jgi:hypothetical protein
MAAPAGAAQTYRSSASTAQLALLLPMETKSRSARRKSHARLLAPSRVWRQSELHMHVGDGSPRAALAPRVITSTALVAFSLLIPSHALARDPKFSAFDVQTVFYISKSDDRNRVDYGIHLDANCAPVGDDAVFQYWREFENSPPVRVHGLGMFEYIPYGISEQRTISRTSSGGSHTIKLRQLDKMLIRIVTQRGADGRCSAEARTVINRKECVLIFAYVKLRKGGLAPSVDYIDLHGRDVSTGQEVLDRLQK